MEVVPALTPSDHVRLLHPATRRGITTIATRDGKWIERVVPIVDLPSYAAAMRGATDTFVSQQSFWGWRRIAQLAQLGALYSDLDYQKTARAGQTPESVAYQVLRTLDDARIPPPSWILATGRGLLVAWLHDMIPRAALPRWMAVQRQLLDVLKPFGADPKAIDAARVFRIVGTHHSIADAIVRPIWMAPEIEARWDFDELAREILPMAREQIAAMRAARGERIAPRTIIIPAKRLTAGSYWEAVLTDLQRLRQLRWFGSLPPGHRDTWLFVAGNAMAWLSPAFVLRRELNALGAEAGGWHTAESDARLSSVIDRAAKAARGEKQEWNGRAVDARYRFKAATIVTWLAIMQHEMRDADLRVLIDSDVRRERATEREAASRRRRGVVLRSDYETGAIEADRPWERGGISRATWFRRRSVSRETSP